jgi:hypothetical protein
VTLCGADGNARLEEIGESVSEVVGRSSQLAGGPLEGFRHLRLGCMI